jgi:nitroreductase
MSIKIAQTQYPIHELMRKRWSARSFQPQTAISPTDMNRLLEAASWAFSANNLQPWHYIYAHNGSEGFDKLWNCLAGGNQPWAKNASLLLICLAQTNSGTDNPNPWAKHDLGAANTNLILQATAMDIYAHVMAGFNAQQALSLSNLDPNAWEAVTMIALGYLDDAEKLPEPFKTRELSPRTRKPLDQFSQAI